MATDEETIEKMRGTKEIWDTYHRLVSLTMQDQVNIKEAEWVQMARNWGLQFVTWYCPEDVTPYVHAFVYHLGFSFEK